VARVTSDVPPRIHDLLRLAEIAGLTLNAEQARFLGRMQQFCLAGRYPDLQRTVPAAARVSAELGQAHEVLAWLQTLLP
jgi:HEPN domain-containing protein